MGAWPPVSDIVFRNIMLACQTCLTDLEVASTCCYFQMSSTVSNGLGFASYETGLSMYRKMYEGVTPGPAERGVIAGGAAVTVMAAIQPLEVCCRRMQASSLDISPSLPGTDNLGSRVISLHEASLTMYCKMIEGVTPGPAEGSAIAGGAAVTVMAAIQSLGIVLPAHAGKHAQNALLFSYPVTRQLRLQIENILTDEWMRLDHHDFLT